MHIKGQCLCGTVRFELSGDVPGLYQCHCSLCRKVTGSAANAALIISREQFNWSSGLEQVHEFTTASGFKSHFCSECGSPMPNLTANDSAYWVPVGLLENDQQLKLVAHLYVASRAHWDVIADSGQHFETMPERSELRRFLADPKPLP